MTKQWLSSTSWFGNKLLRVSLDVLRGIIVLGGVIIILFFAYRYSFDSIINGSWVIGLLVFWVLTAYITLPRVHRSLTKLYLPNYYVGRSRTGDGLLGDPINVAVNGSAKNLRAAMLAAGWVETDRATRRNMLRMVKATVLGQEYLSAPGSTQYLFDNQQVYSFQKGDGSTSSRHHVRFWKTPRDWWLPGGFQADWLAAVHYDTHIGLGLFNWQIMHKISASIDIERDMLVADLRQSGASVHTIKHFSSGLHGRGGGGDHIRTDGAMPFVTLHTPQDTLTSPDS